MESGGSRVVPFSPGGAAYLARSDSDTDRRLPQGSQQGHGGGADRYELVAVYEWFAHEYGWSPDYIDHHLTDEQFALYATKAGKRRQAQAFADLDRLVIGTSWGVSIAFDHKGRTGRKWQGIRNKQQRDTGQSRGLTGAALEAAVMAIAAADSSLVKIEQRGAN